MSEDQEQLSQGGEEAVAAEESGAGEGEGGARCEKDSLFSSECLGEDGEITRDGSRRTVEKIQNKAMTAETVPKTTIFLDMKGSFPQEREYHKLNP